MTTTAPAPTVDSAAIAVAPPLPDRVERVAEALRAHNIEAIVVETAAQAREAVLERVPLGAELHSGKSKTIEDLGLFAEMMDSGKYDAIRPKLYKMDRATQGREMRKLGASPDYELGSVAAITEDGILVSASATGNQIAAYAGGAGRVILVAGVQKIVKDLDEALARINDVVFPYENGRLMEQMGVPTKLTKVLLHIGEYLPGRTTVILVREPIGV
jgi:LUD domain